MTNKKQIKLDELANFRFEKINDKYLLTNDCGDYLKITENEFKKITDNKLDENGKLYNSLLKKNFIRDKIDLDAIVERYRDRKKYLLSGGPTLHIIVVTLRCNQNCIYCHASAKSMDEKGLDMSEKTADKTLDIIFDSTNEHISIEFQGGEPLANWPIIKYIVKGAQERNSKAKKDLVIKLVSNFSLLDEKKYKFLIKNNVSLCTSLDGPKDLHNRNRPIDKADSYNTAISWIKRANKEYEALEKKGYIWKLSAITTVSRFSLEYPKEIVDEHIKLGFNNIYLRPLNPFGLSREIIKKIGYGPEEYVSFYKEALDYIIKKNLEGTKFVERYAKYFLKKILSDSDPNNLDMRSPCGAGIGQLAYNYNGNVYTCDEGRMLSMMGDESFLIGSVYKNDYKEIITHPVTRALCSASCLETVPGCSDCVYMPYCGVCPVYNYFEQDNIYGQMPTNERCKINMAILTYLFEKMDNKKIKNVFADWVYNSY